MIDDTRLRFLKAIAAQLDVERIAEVHLFPAIRQGGMESGVAVLAVEPVRELAAVAAAIDDATAEVDSGAEPTADAEVAGEPATPAASIDEVSSPASDDDAESPYAEPDAPRDDESSDPEEEQAIVLEAVAAPESRPAPRRFTVYTARYRHTLKGPDRGKWEVSLTEEADAPLLTVDAVVRGVQRRSGDVDEIVRMSGTEVAGVTGARGE